MFGVFPMLSCFIATVEHFTANHANELKLAQATTLSNNYNLAKLKYYIYFTSMNTTEFILTKFGCVNFFI